MSTERRASREGALAPGLAAGSAGLGGLSVALVPPGRLSTGGDRAAIALAALCAVHCLALPLIVPLLPWLALLTEHDQAVHRWLLLAIVPVSAYALMRGWSGHRRLGIVLLGGAAMGLLVAAPFAEFLPQGWEAILTLCGSAILSFSHLLNLQTLRQWSAPAQHSH